MTRRAVTSAGRRLRVLGLLLAVIGLLTVPQPGSASADGYVAVSELLSAGSVRASGVAAEVSVRVTCLRPRDLQLDVELRQALPGGRIALATGQAIARCRPGTQTVVAPLVAQGGPALTDGPAAVHLDTLCTSYAYTHACRLLSERVVHLRADRSQDALAGTAVSEPALGISVAATGHLHSGGKAVDVEAALSCPPGAEPFTYAYLVQLDGSVRVAAESYPDALVCDGNDHPTTLRLDAVRGRIGTGTAFLLSSAFDDAHPPWSGVAPSVSVYGEVELS